MTLQQALAAALRAGFLSLAQARYSMGADRVSALQYPTHMQATARVVAAPGAAVASLASLLACVWASRAAMPISCTDITPEHISTAGDGTLELLLAPTKTAGERAAATRAAVPSPAAAAAVASVAATAPTAGQTDTAAAAATEPQAAAAASSSDGTPAATPSTAAATGGAGAGAEDVAGALQRLRLVAQHADSIMEQLAAKYCSDGARWADGEGVQSGVHGQRACA